MNTSLPILAQPLAPDCIWFALLLLVVLAFIHRVDGLIGRIGGRQHVDHHLREISHWLHERITHRHP